MNACNLMLWAGVFLLKHPGVLASFHCSQPPGCLPSPIQSRALIFIPHVPFPPLFFFFASPVIAWSMPLLGRDKSEGAKNSVYLLYPTASGQLRWFEMEWGGRGGEKKAKVTMRRRRSWLRRSGSTSRGQSRLLQAAMKDAGSYSLIIAGEVS